MLYTLFSIYLHQVFVVAVLAAFPLLPQNLSNRAYWLSLTGTACSSLYSLYSLYGVRCNYNFLNSYPLLFYSYYIQYIFICFIEIYSPRNQELGTWKLCEAGFTQYLEPKIASTSFTALLLSHHNSALNVRLLDLFMQKLSA